MISSIELLSLALEGNIESGEYMVIPTKCKSGRNVSFEILLSDLLEEYDAYFEDVHACAGSINHGREVGYLVKNVETIPTAHNLLGAVDAIYEVDKAEGENLYYAVWVITSE